MNPSFRQVLRRLGSVGLLVCLLACGGDSEYTPRDGDILFQTSRSEQSQAIQLATHSRYSHMGVVTVEDGTPYVFEAVGPVKRTPLAEWIARGEVGHFVAKRLRRADEVLTAAALGRMREVGRDFVDRGYDHDFAWSDDQLYCSELVWKIYQRALGLEIGALQKFGEFDLSHPVVQAKMHERWGDALPLDEPVISPAAMFASGLLRTVHEE